MNVLSYGGGTDSTAIICGWVEQGLQESRPIKNIVFADTGAERPETYEYIEFFSEWCQRHGLPKIDVIRKGGNGRTLEEDCLIKNTLPSLAFGRKGCSHKWKIEPQNKYCNNTPWMRSTWALGGKVNKLIGYEFAEAHRWMKAKLEDDKYTYEFPLVEWEWSRPDCLEAIERVVGRLPGKSACFFCPASKKPEIIALSKNHPDLLQRALLMERNAKESLKTCKGLGRSFNWNEWWETESRKGRRLRVISVAELRGGVSNSCLYCVDN